MDYSLSPDLGDFMDSADMGYKADAPPPPDPLSMISLFPELTNETTPQPQQQSQPQQQQQAPQQVAIISHMTPSTGATRGGTLVTIHGSGFTVGEMIYVCFGETLVPVIPQHHHMIECFTPAATKAETVAVFALQNTTPSNIPAQATFTYVDDNENELMKLALQRMMNISARMDGPVDSVLTRANEFALWNDLLSGSSSTSSTADSTSTYQNLENMVMDSFKRLDTPVAKNVDGLSITNMTGHTMLHLSVPLQYQDLAKDLIDRGIDLTIQDKNGMTALNWAQRIGDQAMIDLIAEAANFEAPAHLQSKEDVAMIAHQAAGNDKAVHYRDHHMEAARSLVSMENRGHPNLYEGNGYSGLSSPPGKIIDSSPLQSLAPVTIRDHPHVAAVYEHNGHCGVAPDVTANVLPPPTVGVQHSDPGMDFEWSGSPPVAAAKSTMMMSAIPSVGPLPLLRDDGVEQAAPIQTPGLPRVITRVRPPSPTDIIDTGRMNDIDVVVRDHERVLLPVETQLEVASFGQDFQWVARGAESQVVVVRRNSNDVGGSVDAAEQAVVQSSRYDVESESVLFLGGMPVVVAPRATTAATASVNGTASSNARQERDSTGSAPSHQGNGSHEMNNA